jgi:hypothetical protein
VQNVMLLFLFHMALVFISSQERSVRWRTEKCKNFNFFITSPNYKTTAFRKCTHSDYLSLKELRKEFKYEFNSLG